MVMKFVLIGNVVSSIIVLFIVVWVLWTHEVLFCSCIVQYT
jgi:hypothetical protein